MHGNGDKFRLSLHGLPVINDLDEFSILTHVSKGSIFRLSKYADYHYKVFEIPKRNGTPRTIAHPSKSLKGLQAWVLVNILNKVETSPSCKGFEKGSSIADNARAHIGAGVILTLDLRDFFASVKSPFVFKIFRSIGYNAQISTVLTNLCTFQGRLPQGGPCSPKLANLALWRLDNRIQGLVRRRGITYTRYADDLTFSGYHPNDVCKIIPLITLIIEDEGFEINSEKTRVKGASRAKRVTGLVITEKSFGIGKWKFKELRTKIHRLSLPEFQHDEALLRHVKGWLAYLQAVDPKRLITAKKYIDKLTKKSAVNVTCLIEIELDRLAEGTVSLCRPAVGFHPTLLSGSLSGKW